MESVYANVLRRVRVKGALTSNEDAKFLTSFWMFQHLRTEATQQSILRMSRALENVVGSPHPQISIDGKNATRIALNAFSSRHYVVADTNIILIENRTSLPFITSDNPAIQTNRWVFSQTSRPSANFGMLSAGFIGLLPLAPELLVLMYDKDIYSIEKNKKRLKITDDFDSRALNEHQYLNCMKNVYFRGGSDELEIGQKMSTIKNSRMQSKEMVQIFDRSRDATDKRYYRTDHLDTSKSGEALLVTTSYSPRPSEWPQFLHWRPNGCYFSNGSGIGQVRRASTLGRSGVRPFKKLKTGR